MSTCPDLLEERGRERSGFARDPFLQFDLSAGLHQDRPVTGVGDRLVTGRPERVTQRAVLVLDRETGRGQRTHQRPFPTDIMGTVFALPCRVHVARSRRCRLPLIGIAWFLFATYAT